MGIIANIKDGLTSVLTGMGGSLDPRSSNFYISPILTQSDLETSYRGSWLSKKVIDVPALDMTRAWRKWSADDDAVTDIEREERRLGLRQKVYFALRMSRLYGGAAIMIGVRNDDPSEPLDVSRIGLGDLEYLHVMTRHQLIVSELDMDPGSRTYGEPLAYQVAQMPNLRIHPSRMVRFIPNQLPENLAASQSGWGDPTLQTILSAIMDADASAGHFSALVQRSRSDTVTVPGLAEKATTKAGEAELVQRFQLLSAFQSQFNVRILAGPNRQGDAGEEWQAFQASFAGIPEVQNMFWQAVSGASDIPLTRMIGMSPGGLNSTGQHDSANYDQMISAGQEMDLRPRLEIIDEALIRSATGRRDENTWFSFNPLTVDSETTKTENALKRAQAIKALADAGSVPSEVLMAGTRGALIESGEYPGIDAAYDEWDRAGEVEPLPTETEAENDNALLSLTNRGVAVGDALAVIRDAEPRTLYVSRPVLNGEEIAKWYADQGVTGILAPEKMHVTIAYSKTPVDWMKVAADDWGGDPKLTVAEGGPRMNDMFGPESDTLVLMFNSSRLGYRHEEILRAGASWDWPDYQPHVSIAYGLETDISGVKPWTGPIEFGAERFEEVQENWSDD